jgi:hypothetical protein
MGVKILQIIASIFFIFIISQPLSFSDTYTCKCEFDTNEYEATGYFSGTCSYTMNETRKKCEIRRAEDYQDIKKSLIRYDKFGDPSELRLEILPITAEFYYNHHTLIELNPIHFFSFMMRSSYLAAPFLSDEEKGIIDDLLLNMIEKHGHDMLLIFAGLYAENTFKEEPTTMYVNKGTARLTVNINGNNILICTKVLPVIQD